MKCFSILWPMKNDVRFEYVPWKNALFCFIWTVWIDFNHETEKLRFWKSLNNFNFFFLIKKMMSDLNIILSNIVWFGLSFLVAAEFGKRFRNTDFKLLNIFQLEMCCQIKIFPAFLPYLFVCFFVFFWHYCRNSFKLKMSQMILI